MNQQKAPISFRIIMLLKNLVKPYTTTRIKSINFLSNISYVGINKEDFYNQNFVFDIYALMTTNLNPFSLDRKLSDQNKHEMIYMVWKECTPGEFYKYICLKENFLYLNGKNVLYRRCRIPFKNLSIWMR